MPRGPPSRPPVHAFTRPRPQVGDFDGAERRDAFSTNLFRFPRARAAGKGGRCSDASSLPGCRFKLVCEPETLNVVTMHVDVPCWKELSSIGGQKTLNSVFEGMVAKPDAGYKVAVSVDCDACGDAAGTLAKLINIKRHLIGAPFTSAFEALAAGTATKGPVAKVPWRDGAEAVYVVAGNDPANVKNYDRVTVIYAIDFPEEADRAFARVMCQQLGDTRKVANAPPVVFSEAKAPPAEIRALVETGGGFFGGGAKQLPDIVGYVSFTVFKQHVDTPEKLAKRVDLCVGFRNYLHYHIKAAKTNQHMRMRRKVMSWLQILNRAVPVKEAEKKTATGRTFTRK